MPKANFPEKTANEFPTKGNIDSYRISSDIVDIRSCDKDMKSEGIE